nr:hypothetical protein Itr_chr06CG17580 [Ipomoea trifida]
MDSPLRSSSSVPRRHPLRSGVLQMATAAGSAMAVISSDLQQRHCGRTPAVELYGAAAWNSSSTTSIKPPPWSSAVVRGCGRSER